MNRLENEMEDTKTELLLKLIHQELLESKQHYERIAREQKTMRELMSKFVNFMADAESEMPEWYRRFTNAMHDVHDIKYMYEDVGIVVPPHILRECERLDDRFRQVLNRLNIQGGAFEKIRREMAADPLNRWDHTKLLEKPKENENEAGKSE
jgi:hypothetical protein